MKKPLTIPIILAFIQLVACTNAPDQSEAPLPAESALPSQSPSIQPTLTVKFRATSIPTVAFTLTVPASCQPTRDDGLSPSYQPDAPVRTTVGHAHVLTGTVRSSRDCLLIKNAKLEFWPEYAGQGHPDEARATLFTDSSGSYRFECNPPEHIHMRISATGFRTIAQNSYHPEGEATGSFDIVLEPEEP